ncbi:MAG: signal peptidase II [Bacilli bacterium]
MLIYIISIIVLFLIDFVSKLLTISTIGLHTSINVIGEFFKLNYVQNTGAAFSIFENNVQYISIITLLILTFFIYEFVKSKDRLIKIGLSIIIVGIIGNLYDRIVYGYVIDMFEFNIFGYNAPIFNIADIFVTVGIIFYTIICFYNEVKNGNNK